MRVPSNPSNVEYRDSQQNKENLPLNDLSKVQWYSVGSLEANNYDASPSTSNNSQEDSSQTDDHHLFNPFLYYYIAPNLELDSELVRAATDNNTATNNDNDNNESSDHQSQQESTTDDKNAENNDNNVPVIEITTSEDKETMKNHEINEEKIDNVREKLNKFKIKARKSNDYYYDLKLNRKNKRELLKNKEKHVDDDNNIENNDKVLLDEKSSSNVVVDDNKENDFSISKSDKNSDDAAAAAGSNNDNVDDENESNTSWNNVNDTINISSDINTSTEQKESSVKSNNNEIEETTESEIIKSQSIVPQILIDFFISMADPEAWWSINTTEIPRFCAFYFPAVVLTLGKENWNMLKAAYGFLSDAREYKVRRTMASSIHEVAMILGEELSSQDLLPIYDGFIKDLDEVRIGALKHLSTFLKVLKPADRCFFLPRLKAFLALDNEWNWRFREEAANRFLETIPLFNPRDVYTFIVPLSFPLLVDKVAAVRQMARALVN